MASSVISEMDTSSHHTNNYPDVEAENGQSSPRSQFDELASTTKSIKQEVVERTESGTSTPSNSSHGQDAQAGKANSINDMMVTSLGTSSPSIKATAPAMTIAGQISNAGRKKSNPVWEFYIDLRTQGLNAVKCRHCDYLSEDRSPSAMRLHIRKFHDTGVGGLWYQLEQKTLQQIPHKYTKSRESFPGMIGRKRGSVDANGAESGGPSYDDALLAAAKALLMQNQASTSSDGITNMNVLNALAAQNPEMVNVLHQQTTLAASAASSEAATSEATIKVEQADADDDEADSSMPKFEIRDQNASLEALDLITKTQLEEKRPRMNNWIHLGTFDNEEDMVKCRQKEKVSKRRTEQLKNGIKIRYRCNRWKKTKCAFQMYAFYTPEGKIDLYESGVHDHTGKNLLLFQQQQQSKPQPPINSNHVKMSQEEILNSLLMQLNSGTMESEVVTVGNNNADEQDPLKSLDGIMNSLSAQEPPSKMPKLDLQPSLPLVNGSNLTQSSSNTIDNVPALLAALSQQGQNGQPLQNGTPASAPVVPQSSKTDFILASGDSIASLLEIATELELVFTFNSRNTAEYCFQSNLPSLKDRMVVLIDLGDKIQVSERVNSESIKDESWTKGDWKQFLWAVRGKCCTFLKEAIKRPQRPFTLS